jgi:fatty acyl-CoA reductase
MHSLVYHSRPMLCDHLLLSLRNAFSYRNFCRPMSVSHIISGAAGSKLSPTIRLASRFETFDQDSTINYVPVDVVVDRLLVHVAYGTTGPVHAVAGAARTSLQDSWS